MSTATQTGSDANRDEPRLLGRSNSSMDIDLDALAEQARHNYGTIDTNNSTDGDDSWTAPVASEVDLRTLRERMEVLITLSILRRKYRARMLICFYVAIGTGLAPLCVYLFLQSTSFSAWYLTYSDLLHTVVYTLNMIVFYIYMASGFNLQNVFTAVRVDPLHGHMIVMICAGSMFAIEAMDQVAVFLKRGYFNSAGIFLPTGIGSGPPDIKSSQRGMSPDSWIFSACLYLGLLSAAMAIVNAFNVLYYRFAWSAAARRDIILPNRVG